MPEDLTPGDVEQYTQGRILESDPEAVRALDAALAKARRWCGWHVTPVRTDTFTVYGEGHPEVFVPTLAPIQLLSIVETDDQGNVNTIDLTTIRLDRTAPGIIRKLHGHWLYDSEIVIELVHGFQAVDAADFREAVLQMIDTASYDADLGGNGPLEEKQVDDVTYRWMRVPDRLLDAIARNPMDASALYGYRIIPIA